MKCKYLGDNGICTYYSDVEVTEPCIEGPCEHDTTRTASPRFTAEEREAMDRVAYHAEADLENRWIKSSQIYKEDTTAIATVRKMLEGSV